MARRRGASAGALPWLACCLVAAPCAPALLRKVCRSRWRARNFTRPPHTLCRRDEENLEENERIKKELNPRKIGWWGAGVGWGPAGTKCPACRRRPPPPGLTPGWALHPLFRCADEPKTPYLSPMDTDEEGDLGGFIQFLFAPVGFPPARLLAQLLLPQRRTLLLLSPLFPPRVPCRPAGSCMRPLALEDAASAAAAAVAASADMSSAPSGGTTSDDGAPLALGRGRWAFA